MVASLGFSPEFKWDYYSEVFLANPGAAQLTKTFFVPIKMFRRRIYISIQRGLTGGDVRVNVSGALYGITVFEIPYVPTATSNHFFWSTITSQSATNTAPDYGLSFMGGQGLITPIEVKAEISELRFDCSVAVIGGQGCDVFYGCMSDHIW